MNKLRIFIIISIILFAQCSEVLAVNRIYCPRLVVCSGNSLESCSPSRESTYVTDWHITKVSNLPRGGGVFYFSTAINVGAKASQDKSPECDYYPISPIQFATYVGVIGPSYFVAYTNDAEDGWEMGDA